MRTRRTFDDFLAEGCFHCSKGYCARGLTRTQLTLGSPLLSRSLSLHQPSPRLLVPERLWDRADLAAYSPAHTLQSSAPCVGLTAYLCSQ